MINYWLICNLKIKLIATFFSCPDRDDGATNHHCQHRHDHQLQTAVTWVLDELERNPKKWKSSKCNFQDDGHLSSGQAVHV